MNHAYEWKKVVILENKGVKGALGGLSVPRCFPQKRSSTAVASIQMSVNEKPLCSSIGFKSFKSLKRLGVELHPIFL